MANAADVDVVDFEPEEDDLMDEEGLLAEQQQLSPTHQQQPRIRSAITGGSSLVSDVPKKTKGRGFREEGSGSGGVGDRFGLKEFESLDSDGGRGPQRSVEGWIVLVSGIHEEAQEDDLHNAFGEFGEIRNLHLNLDRRTGFVKGYALIEFAQKEEAQAAIAGLDGADMLTQTISVDWAFTSGPLKRRSLRKRSPRGHRSRSPRRRY